MERGAVRLNKIVFWIHTTGKQQLTFMAKMASTCTAKCCHLVLPLSYHVTDCGTVTFSFVHLKKKSKCKEIMRIGVHKHHESEERAPSPLQQQYQAVTLVNKAQIQHTSQVWSVMF